MIDLMHATYNIQSQKNVYLQPQCFFHPSPDRSCNRPDRKQGAYEAEVGHGVQGHIEVRLAGSRVAVWVCPRTDKHG